LLCHPKAKAHSKQTFKNENREYKPYIPSETCTMIDGCYGWSSGGRMSHDQRKILLRVSSMRPQPRVARGKRANVFVWAERCELSTFCGCGTGWPNEPRNVKFGEACPDGGSAHRLIHLSCCDCTQVQPPGPRGLEHEQCKAREVICRIKVHELLTR
jgi:hypothetical protein